MKRFPILAFLLFIACVLAGYYAPQKRDPMRFQWAEKAVIFALQDDSVWAEGFYTRKTYGFATQDKALYRIDDTVYVWRLEGGVTFIIPQREVIRQFYDTSQCSTASFAK